MSRIVDMLSLAGSRGGDERLVNAFGVVFVGLFAAGYLVPRIVLGQYGWPFLAQVLLGAAWFVYAFVRAAFAARKRGMLSAKASISLWLMVVGALLKVYVSYLRVRIVYNVNSGLGIPLPF